MDVFFICVKDAIRSISRNVNNYFKIMFYLFSQSFLLSFYKFLNINIVIFSWFVLVCPSQVKISNKNFFLRFLWKIPCNLILIWRIQKLNSFPHIFWSSSSFLPRFVKNDLKNESKFFSQIFMKISVQPNFDMENS